MEQWVAVAAGLCHLVSSAFEFEILEDPSHYLVICCSVWWGLVDSRRKEGKIMIKNKRRKNFQIPLSGHV